MMQLSRTKHLGALLVALATLAAQVVVFVLPASAAPPSWQAEYFANPDLQGAPVLTRTDNSIDFDWGAGSPAPSVPVDQFSVRWTATIHFEAGTYRFSTFTDDGARLFVDGALVIDKFVGQPPTEWQAEVAFAEGDHLIVMEYFEGFGDAVARLSYGPVQTPIPAGAWEAQFYGNKTLSNQPILTRADPVIDFEWGEGTPAFGVPANNFSVRWTRTVTLSAGTYRFETTTDDGVRVKIDGTTVINDFVEHALAFNEAEVPLAAGDHTFVVEYFEGFGEATAKMNWALKAADGVVRLNSGGLGYADSVHNYWDPDGAFTGGGVSEETQPIWNTTDDRLFVNERFGAFSYAVPVAAGNYIVRLHFAELFFAAPGVRRFNVALEGASVLSNLDIYNEAGKASLITKSFPVSVGDGTLNIAFTKVFDNASVQAIDVYPAGAGQDLAGPVFGAIPEPENATHTVAPAVSLSLSDNVALKDGYWRIDDQDPQPLFDELRESSFGAQFTMPIETFNNLSLGQHVLSFGANDEYGNATVKKWRFRKLLTGGGQVPIAFERRVLVSPSTPGASLFKQPTTMQFGPDGKLYVGQQNGYIHVLTLDANRNVTNVTRYNTIHDTPNVNPDGSPAPTVAGRHLIGIDFDPASTPQDPILWAVHSDPRFCFNKTPQTCLVNVDSGILTRLDGPAFDTPGARTDLVTGIPRSRENHAPNAVHFGEDGWLYMAMGSDTNYGAPSSAFSGLAERFLTAGVLRFNVNGAAGQFPIDVRAVDTPGELEPGVFELYATGYRNPYDFLWHSNGSMYINVNAGNFTAGTTPGPEHGCANGVAFDPGTRNDYLAIVAQGDHGGHPDPARGQCVLDDGSVYSPPKNPDPNYRQPILHYANGTSSDGMTEYTAPTFGGQMLGNIISATFAGNQSVRRVVLANDGQSVLFEEDLAIFTQPLDVATDEGGSIYVAEYGANDIEIMEPDPALTGEWTVNAPLPVATTEMGVVTCAGKMYVVGGLVGTAQDTNAVWVYNPGTGIWSAGPDKPGQAVDHPGAACVNDKVYVFGGLIGAGAAVKATWELDTVTGTWTQRADMLKSRGGMGVAVYGGKIYAAGGLAGPAVTDMTVFDPVANTWSTLAPMPTNRDHLIMEAIDGRLYAIGGRNVTQASVTAANEAYDPVTNTWSARTPMPVARAGMASGALHGNIQIWGGEGPSGTPTGTYPQGHQYDPETDTWITIADELTPRHGTDGATIGHSVHVPAGGPQMGNAATDVNEAFSFVSTEPPQSCINPNDDPRTTDSDGDGYTDQDEADNNSDPCSTASVPPDNDEDDVSDLNDADDDNDGVADVADQYQRDPTNGASTVLPWNQEWNPGDPPAGKFSNSGFPGVQLTSNGTGAIEPRVHVGGAGGFMSVDATAGTNEAATNSQDNALQVGFDAGVPMQITTRITDVLAGQIVESGKAGGIFFGLDEDNYAKLVVGTDVPGSATTGIQFAVETNGNFAPTAAGSPVALTLPGPTTIDLRLKIDPAAQTVTAQYRVNSDGAFTTIGTAGVSSFAGLAPFFASPAAAGVLLSNQAPSPFGLAFDWFHLEAIAGSQPPVADAGPDATVNNNKNFTLDASNSSDPGPGPLQFVWTQIGGPPAVIRDEDQAQTIIEGVAGPATLTFRVTVTNPDGLQDTDDVVVTVKAPK